MGGEAKAGGDMTYAIDVAVITARPARAVAMWLLACAAMVFVMVVLGGLTRLTESGLSMMDWKPLTVVPPMNEQDWLFWFEKYKTIPQYKNLFPDMTLAGFKGIFWLEYLHRVWGRLIGVVFFVPFVYFLIKGHVSRELARKLALLFVLGGLQGGMGWYMVASGFSQEVSVSQYRLAAHLVFAVVIYGAILWTAFDLLWPKAAGRGVAGLRGLRRSHVVLLILAGITITSGGFVAGLDAGLIYNTFPLMGGSLVPPDVLAERPWWRNFFDNHATVQFTHRVLAVTLFVLVVAMWWRARRMALPARARHVLGLVPAVAALQVALGISTLLLVVPVSLAAAHQAGALVLLTALLLSTHALRERA